MLLRHPPTTWRCQHWGALGAPAAPTLCMALPNNPEDPAGGSRADPAGACRREGRQPPLQHPSASRNAAQPGLAGSRAFRGAGDPAVRRAQPPPPQQQPPQQPSRPRVPFPIVVEGPSDKRAVQRAVEAEVYVLHGTTRTTARALGELRRLREQHGGLVLLLDADVAGRQARNVLENCLPGCYHAFVPAPLATSAAATGRHEAGNVGVEHAPPQAIRRALQRARRGCAERAEFSREELVGLGLISPHHLPTPDTAAGVAARRALVCAYLGVGNCDGKQLLRQLNAYGFLWEDLLAAEEWARRQLEPQSRPAEAEQGRPGQQVQGLEQRGQVRRGRGPVAQGGGSGRPRSLER